MTPRRDSQAELRRRRRAHLPTVNTGKFSAICEIADVAGPLADRITRLASPLRLRRQVLNLADAVHEFAGTATRWDAERDARQRTEHLADDPAARRWAMTTICDLAPRPALPEITDEMIADGTWAAALVEMVTSVDRPLADLLARAFPPGAPALRGQPSRSDRLDNLLRETVDRAALSLERALDTAEKQTAVLTAAKPDPRAELSALGIEV
ncbi:hypothetical protein A4G26_25820 [Mycobacterium kansasii]|uniref:Uncharacterized protein n=1 Tax=Mycobacterium innocens TaxID=2341083 RepID=A0A498QM24_9MYCO|nr:MULTISPECIES: hypothetical protein [Mycobacterium]KZS70062.1 hypothetical protein A4G26_25820 [Mycobacterium kansasii]VBA46634.1 hypothetical protein LAUMK13_05701 [Mycobacterium innocens]